MAGPVPVFVVEDSLHMQSALRDLVQAVGPFQVVGTAAGESEATEWIQARGEPWGLAIVDLLLADGSGFGIVHRCRKDRPDGRVVVFSEYASPGVKDRCKSLGADAVFLKSEMKSFIHFLERAAIG